MAQHLHGHGSLLCKIRDLAAGEILLQLGRVAGGMRPGWHRVRGVNGVAGPELLPEVVADRAENMHRPFATDRPWKNHDDNACDCNRSAPGAQYSSEPVVCVV